MNRFARMLFAGIGIVAVGSAISLVPHKTANAGGMTAVTVTNPSLAVTQSGPWNVGINGIPSVNATITNQVPVTGTVNANVAFPANQNVTLNPQSLLGLGKLPSQQFAIFADSYDACSPGWRDEYTGQCFSAPSGTTLVVTDIDWLAGTVITTPAPSGHLCSAILFGTGKNVLYSVYGDSDADGYVSKNEHLSGGVYIPPSAQLSGAPNWSVNTLSCKPVYVNMRGYVVPNQ